MQPLRYLFVCTANINRSPMAATWTEHHLAQRFVIAEIRSAGTHAWDGSEAGAYAIDAMRELGHDMRAHRSQPVSEALLDWASHVVIMQPMHEEKIAGRVDAAKIVRLWDFVEGADRVVDPQGHPLDEFRTAAASIRDATSLMVKAHLATRRAQLKT
ncbi:MAG: low molecular weight protein arginine phosphatase [Proteobacteria bacterium]|nr:low molecular weight protein arginine phosphatase [Pseudomonadota bacterium]